MLGDRLGLSRVERELLALSTLRECCSPFVDFLRLVPRKSPGRFSSLLALALATDAERVKAALARDATLRRAGIIKIFSNSNGSPALETPEEIVDALLAENRGIDELLAHFLVAAPATSLKVADYPHLRRDIELVGSILKSALRERECGVNILLHGPPGTGKSELARLLARRARCALFEVHAEDRDGDPLSSDKRLARYRLCQQLLAEDRRALVVFDEIEDVFPVRSFSLFGLETRSSGHKAWLNRTLEENPRPAIWISNRIEQIDPAFLRRFDFILELPTPPKAVRRKIIRRKLAGLPVSRRFIDRLASHETLAPAQIASLARPARRLRPFRT